MVESAFRFIAVWADVAPKSRYSGVFRARLSKPEIQHRTLENRPRPGLPASPRLGRAQAEFLRPKTLAPLI